MSSKQSGFSIVEGIIAVVVVAVLGFIGWTAYNSYIGKPAKITSQTPGETNASTKTKINSTNQSGQQSIINTNLVTDYFTPANISFAHDKKWMWDTSGETYGYYEHPNEKTAQLRLPYQGPNDTLPSKYTMGFTSDSVPPPTQSGMDTLIKLGQVALGSQTLYILHGYFANEPEAGRLI